MQNRIGIVVVSTIFAAGLTLTGCGKSESSSTSAAATTPAASGGAPAWVLVAMPEGVVDVAAAKKTLKEGDTVAIRGRIGGRVDPVSKDAAFFVIMDPAVPSCADNPGDNCSTPWDYCCETPASLAANNATVRVVDAAGAPVQTGIEAFGFHPLDTVVIVGTVGPRPSPEVLTITATGVHRVGG